jgi:hypothetical protein
MWRAVQTPPETETNSEVSDESFAGETPAVVRPLGRVVSTGEDCAM